MKLSGKEILAVASDFDGTIIKKGMTKPPALFFDAVDELFKNNIPFIAASGRQYANLRKILAPIADKIDYIAENGCLVICRGKVIHKSTIPRPLVMTLVKDMLKQPGTELLLSGENMGYTVTRNQEFLTMLHDRIQYNLTVLNDYEELPEDIVKMSIYWETGIPRDPESFFHQKYDSRLQVANGGNGWLDFNALGTGKGEALQILSDHLQIPIKNIAAFGDNENDISMLKKAGVSYAVDSAMPHVKAMADHVCDRVEEVILEGLKN